VCVSQIPNGWSGWTENFRSLISPSECVQITRKVAPEQMRVGTRYALKFSKVWSGLAWPQLGKSDDEPNQAHYHTCTSFGSSTNSSCQQNVVCLGTGFRLGPS